MTLEEIKNAIQELSNKVAKYSITPGIVANLLEELRLKLEESFDMISSVVGAVMSISVMPSASNLVMKLTKSDKKEQNVSLPAATKVNAGVMSALDKTNLDYLVNHGATVKFDTAMSATSENGVQNKVIKAYVDGKFDKTNILTVGMQDIVDSHFDSYSVVYIIDGGNLVATILMNTHSQSTKGIIFQHGSGWRIVTEKLGDIIGAGWSQVLEDMDSNSMPIGGGENDDEESRIFAGGMPCIVYKRTDDTIGIFKGYFSGTNHRYERNIKEILYGGFGNNPDLTQCFNEWNSLEVVYPIMIASGFSSMAFFLSNASLLKSIDFLKYIDTSSCTSMNSLFNGCKLIDDVKCISNWDVSKVLSFQKSFYYTFNLKSIIIPEWSNNVCTDTNGMFWGTAAERINISNINTHLVTNMEGMFRSCRHLNWLNAPLLSLQSATSCHAMFYDCSNLKTIIGDTSYEEVVDNNIKVLNGYKAQSNLSIKESNVPLNRASLRAIINGLADLSGQTTKDLPIGTANKAKLSSDDILIATNKNWTIS